MKNLITLTLVCFLVIGQIAGQLSLDNHDPQFGSGLQKGKHQLGLSATNNGSFSLTHRYGLKNDLVLRSSLKIPTLGFTNSSDKVANSYISLGAALGIEKHIPVGKRWSVYYGAEAKVRWANRANSFSYSSVSLVGLAGIKFNLNERVSLFTEINHGYTLGRYQSESNESISNISPNTNIKFGVLFTLGNKK